MQTSESSHYENSQTLNKLKQVKKQNQEDQEDNDNKKNRKGDDCFGYEVPACACGHCRRNDWIAFGTCSVCALIGGFCLIGSFIITGGWCFYKARTIK